ncbi:MAG: Cyclic di-GMP phosphodiesterase PdeB [Pseudomonas delhiensis]|nr:MAG: Cyclic di-GMP phosphodiesterase PdeB [Pseudomonas delhiensis]
MATEKKTIRLLILEDSQNEAERLVSLFRNAGRATRVHRVTSPEDLAEVLQQSWDLFIAAPESQALPPGEALATIRRQSKDIPFLQLLAGRDDDAITEALMLGAQDALPQGEDERLVMIANRELSNLDERRARRAAEVALREAEKRCQLLLDSSVDAITYVHDGMHIYANRAYVSLFGYDDPDELEGLPMIDLVANADQAGFKDFLRGYQNHEGDGELRCGGIRVDGERFDARMSFSPATYDGEPCIQVVIRSEADSSELVEKLREASTLDPVTGLSNRVHFLDLMASAVERAISTGHPATLAYIQIDRAQNLQLELGMANVDSLLADFGKLLGRHFSGQVQLARFSDDVFTALIDAQAPEQVKGLLADLVKKTEAQLFDVRGRTAQLTLSVGAAGLSEKTSKAQDVLDRAHRCADQVVQNGGNGVKVYDPADELAAAANRGDVLAIIRQALEQNSFRLLFQPIISLRGDSYEHYEVLLRLISPQGQEVPAADFISAARTGGMSEKIDRWVLLNSIKLLSEHRAKGHETKLFVHLSGPTLQDPALLPWLSVVLKAARLPGDSLILQISEPDAITYLKQAKELSQGLNDLDCKVALCQFGCALNPFNTLKHMTVDYVKIDGSYVQDLNRPGNQENLKELMSQLNEQKILTIVPMVETASALATLW